MAVEVTIGTEDTSPEDSLEFPMTMQNPDSGTLLLITERNPKGSFKGFILADVTNNPRELGTYSDHWKSNLVPYDGPVVLQNKQ